MSYDLEYGWSRIEDLFKVVKIPWYLTSLIIFFAMYEFYIFLSINIECIRSILDFNTYAVIFDTILLFVYLLSGIPFFVQELRRTFQKIDFKYYHNKSDSLFLQMQVRFIKTKKFYILFLFIIILYYTMVPNAYDPVFPYEKTDLSRLFDIYNITITIFIFYLLAKFLWIFFTIIWALEKIQEDVLNKLIQIEPFNGDRMAGLKSVKKLIMKLIIYLFFAVFLETFNFINPKIIHWQEFFFVFSFFLAEAYLFFRCLFILNSILESIKETKINKYNDLCKIYEEQLLIMISDNDPDSIDKSLNMLLKKIEWLESKRNKLVDLKLDIFDLKTIILFLASSLLPLLSFIEKLRNFF
jgi:hypothetical protein